MTESPLKSFREWLEKQNELEPVWESSAYRTGRRTLGEEALSEFDKAVEALKTRNQESGKFLQWIYDRLEIMYAENPNFDYMLKFKQIIDSLLEGETK